MESPRSVPTVVPLVVDRLPGPLKQRALTCGGVALALFAVVSFGMAVHAKSPRAYLGLCVPVAIGLLSVPWAFQFAYGRFFEWSKNVKTFARPLSRSKDSESQGNDVESWIVDQLSFFRGSTAMYGTGLVLVGWTLLAFYLGGYFSELNSREVTFFCILTCLSAFLAGLGLHAVYGGGRVIWRFGKGKYKILVRGHKFGVLSTGRMLGECLFVISLVCMVYYTSAVLGEKHPYTDFRIWNAPLLMLIVPTAGFLFASFIVCQIPLHRRMIEFKRDELAKVELILDDLKIRADSKVTSELRDNIKFYDDRRLEILALPEWPFGFKSMLGAVGSSVTVVLPSVLSVLV